MRVQDLMKRRVEVIEKDETAERAWNLMTLLKIRHLVVMDGDAVAGIVSERDIGGDDRAERRKTLRVADVMTPHAVQADPETTVRQAANLMRGSSIGCLPVVEKGRLVGIVTTSDLLSLIGRGLTKPVSRSVRWTLARRAPRTAPRIARLHA